MRLQYDYNRSSQVITGVEYNAAPAKLKTSQICGGSGDQTGLFFTSSQCVIYYSMPSPQIGHIIIYLKMHPIC